MSVNCKLLVIVILAMISIGFWTFIFARVFDDIVRMDYNMTPATSQPKQRRDIPQMFSAITDKEKRNSTRLTSFTDELDRGLRNLFYQWLSYTAREVTNTSCIVCHDRTPPAPSIIPTRGPETCNSTEHSLRSLCPCVCLLHSISYSYGPARLKKLNSTCEFKELEIPEYVYPRDRDIHFVYVLVDYKCLLAIFPRIATRQQTRQDWKLLYGENGLH